MFGLSWDGINVLLRSFLSIWNIDMPFIRKQQKQDHKNWNFKLPSTGREQFKIPESACSPDPSSKPTRFALILL